MSSGELRSLTALNWRKANMNRDQKYSLETANKRLEQYEENDKLESFDIFHLYPKEIIYPNGFICAKAFDLFGYNTEVMQFRSLGSHHDALDFLDGGVKRVSVWADGSFLVVLNKNVVGYFGTQLVTVYSEKSDNES
jgi:hypothetical protein